MKRPRKAKAALKPATLDADEDVLIAGDEVQPHEPIFVPTIKPPVCGSSWPARTATTRRS